MYAPRQLCASTLLVVCLGGVFPVWAQEKPPPIPKVDVRAQVQLGLKQAREAGTAEVLPDDSKERGAAASATPAPEAVQPSSNETGGRRSYVPLPNAIITIQDLGDIKRLAAEIDKAKKNAAQDQGSGSKQPR